MITAEHLTTTEQSPFDAHVEKWEGKFVEAYSFPRSLVGACAREISSVEGLPELQIAEEMGTLYAHFCNVKTGNEVPVNPANAGKLLRISEFTGIPEPRLRLLSEVMVGVGIMIKKPNEPKSNPTVENGVDR